MEVTSIDYGAGISSGTLREICGSLVVRRAGADEPARKGPECVLTIALGSISTDNANDATKNLHLLIPVTHFL